MVVPTQARRGGLGWGTHRKWEDQPPCRSGRALARLCSHRGHGIVEIAGIAGIAPNTTDAHKHVSGFTHEHVPGSAHERVPGAWAVAAFCVVGRGVAAHEPDSAIWRGSLAAVAWRGDSVQRFRGRCRVNCLGAPRGVSTRTPRVGLCRHRCGSFRGSDRTGNVHRGMDFQFRQGCRLFTDSYIRDRFRTPPAGKSVGTTRTGRRATTGKSRYGRRSGGSCRHSFTSSPRCSRLVSRGSGVVRASCGSFLDRGHKLCRCGDCTEARRPLHPAHGCTGRCCQRHLFRRCGCLDAACGLAMGCGACRSCLAAADRPSGSVPALLADAPHGRLTNDGSLSPGAALRHPRGARGGTSMAARARLGWHRARGLRRGVARLRSCGKNW